MEDSRRKGVGEVGGERADIYGGSLKTWPFVGWFLAFSYHKTFVNSQRYLDSFVLYCG
jgi:hypothetical protein